MPVLSQHLLWSKTPFAKGGAPPSELTGEQSWALSLRRAVSPSVLPLSAPSLSLLWLWSPRVVSARVPELQPKFMSLMSFCAVQSLGNIRAQISRMSQTSPEGTGIWKGTAQCSPWWKWKIPKFLTGATQKAPSYFHPYCSHRTTRQQSIKSAIKTGSAPRTKITFALHREGSLKEEWSVLVTPGQQQSPAIKAKQSKMKCWRNPAWAQLH